MLDRPDGNLADINDQFGQSSLADAGEPSRPSFHTEPKLDT
jgi:hypothetical protein